MISEIITESFPAPPVELSEILRYACCPLPSQEEMALVRSCLEEALPILEYRLRWCRCSCREEAEELDLGFARTGSVQLRRAFSGCDGVIVFAATLGLGLDRLIARAGRLSPAKGLFFQAIGAERIEALCEAFCDRLEGQLRAENAFPTPRFSPGYGDLPLALQRDIFALLQPEKIGLTLNEGLLMSPSKSVTALVGIAENPAAHAAHRCRSCFLENCAFRKTEE